MELGGNGVLATNLAFRVVLLLGLLFEDKASNVKTGRLKNWNRAVTDRVILLLANGLRQDFLLQKETPFLENIAERKGVLSSATAEGVLTTNAGLRVLLTGRPSEAFIFSLKSANSILEGCGCVVGVVPLEVKGCYYPLLNTKDIFEQLEVLLAAEDQNECLYVVSFDVELKTLDRNVKALEGMVAEKKRTTFVLSSGRGSPGEDGNVDVPVLTWGEAILQQWYPRPVRLEDVAAMVSLLLGRSLPDESYGVVPDHLLNVSISEKFEMMLYNAKHLEICMNEELDKELLRSLKNFGDEEEVVTMRLMLEAAVEKLDGLHSRRMKLSSCVIILICILWTFVFVAAIHNNLTIAFRPRWIVSIATAAVLLAMFSSPASTTIILLFGLMYFIGCNWKDITREYWREGHRTFFLLGLKTIFLTIFVLLSDFFLRVAVAAFVLLWPVFCGIYHRVNRKILALWFVSGVGLTFLTGFPVVGRTPQRSHVAVGGFFYTIQYLCIFRSFKRFIDVHAVVSLGAALAASFFVLSLNYQFFAWGLIFFSSVSVFFISGTLLERFMKLLLIQLVPLILLSTRHETFTYLILTCHLFCWVFLENFSPDVTAYIPSVFSLESTTKSFSGKLSIAHYRQAFLFISYCYLSFFAIGNISSVYSYDLECLRPFRGSALSFLLLAYKPLIPCCAVVSALIVVASICRTTSTSLMMLSLVFSDTIACCLLLYAFILTDLFSVHLTHYVLYQSVTAVVIVLYFFVNLILA